MPAGAATPSRRHPPSHATILYAEPGRPRMPAGAATPSRRHPPSHALFYMRSRGARACRPARQPPAAGTLPAMHYFICGTGAPAHAGRRGNPQPLAPSQPCTILYAEPGDSKGRRYRIDRRGRNLRRGRRDRKTRKSVRGRLGMKCRKPRRDTKGRRKRKDRKLRKM